MSHALLFVIESSYGFLDGKGEADEIAELAAMRKSGMSIVSQTGLELHTRCGDCNLRLGEGIHIDARTQHSRRSSRI